MADDQLIAIKGQSTLVDQLEDKTGRAVGIIEPCYLCVPLNKQTEETGQAIK